MRLDSIRFFSPPPNFEPFPFDGNGSSSTETRRGVPSREKQQTSNKVEQQMIIITRFKMVEQHLIDPLLQSTVFTNYYSTAWSTQRG